MWKNTHISQTPIMKRRRKILNIIIGIKSLNFMEATQWKTNAGNVEEN